MELVNEKRVLDFYIEELDKENITFLKGKPKYSEQIKKLILKLREETEMHNKITICKDLWKILFEASMSFIDPDRRGYDDLFKYFDEYVEFEELIFASDSFYRDHTMHCLWVYFLGEYIIHNEEFKPILDRYGTDDEGIIESAEMIKKNNVSDIFDYMLDFADIISQVRSYMDSVRCICALTHDLGYPIKKINSINKNIKSILPHFGIKNATEFGFDYSDVHDNFIKDFLNYISYHFEFDISSKIPNSDRIDMSKIIENLFINNAEGHIYSINEAYINKLTNEEKNYLKSMEVKKMMKYDYFSHLRYSKNFENYQHGIMSAYLIFRKLGAFYNRFLGYTDLSDIKMNSSDFIKTSVMSEILRSITDHTSEDYLISKLNENSFLTFIDELEEFSRISRANKNREYINEFCKSNIYMEGEYLNIDFIFDNTKIDNLDPERAFKGRCKRFLTLFNIKELDESFKLKLRCIGKLPYDNNVYMLELRNKFANITINGEEKDIQKYLKSKEYLTKEEYIQL